MNNNKLSRIISEVIDNFIAMNNIGIDISKIPLETLKKGYHDYRLIPQTVKFGDRLSIRNRIIEAVGDIVDADEVVRTIINRYNLPNEFVSKVEHHHKIYVYAITALIGKNDKIIEDDKEYLALYPVFDSAEDSVNDSGEYYIMEVILSDDGEEELAELDDEDLLDRLAQQFEERFASMFDDEEE